MRQGDGSDFLDAGDPRRAEIGIVYVEAMDSRPEVLTAINLLNMQGRKQIVLELTEARKVFQQSVDFDGLKQARRDLKAQLIVVAPAGPGPAELARSRHFPVYSSLASLKHLFVPSEQTGQNEPNQPTDGQKKPWLLAFGSRKSPTGPAQPRTLPTPRAFRRGQPVPPTPRTPGTPAHAPTTPPQSGGRGNRLGGNVSQTPGPSGQGPRANTPMPMPMPSVTPSSGLSRTPSHTPDIEDQPTLPQPDPEVSRPRGPDAQAEPSLPRWVENPLSPLPATPVEPRKPGARQPLPPNVQDDDEALYAPSSVSEVPPTPVKKPRSSKPISASQSLEQRPIVFPGAANTSRPKNSAKLNKSASSPLPASQPEPSTPPAQATSQFVALPGQPKKNAPASQPLPNQAKKNAPASQPLPSQAKKNAPASQPLPNQAKKNAPASQPLPVSTPLAAQPSQPPKNQPPAQATSQFVVLPGQVPTDVAASQQQPPASNPFATVPGPPPGSSQRGGTGKIVAMPSATPNGPDQTSGASASGSAQRGNTIKIAAIDAAALGAGAALAAGTGTAMSGVPNPQTPNPVARPSHLTPVSPPLGNVSSGPRQSGLTPLPVAPLPRDIRRKKQQRLLLVGILVLLVVVLLGTLLARGSGLPNILPGQVSAKVIITPISRLEQNNYIITGVPDGSIDTARRQIPARTVTATSPTQTGTGNATGSIQARTASGPLKFLNGNGHNVTVPTSILRGSSGVAVTFNGPINVPAAGTVVVTGFAVNSGAGGNIPAFDISGACCNISEISADNTSAFSGGQNAQPNTVIQQGDIDGAAKPLVTTLTQSTQASLQKLVKVNERVVGDTLQCTPTVSADQQAGNVAKQVHVSVVVACHEEVYDAVAAQQMAVSLLLGKAQSDPALNAQYSQVGQTVASVLNNSIISNNGKVNLEVQVQGLWVYQFTPQLQQNIKLKLVKLTRQGAQNVLRTWPGVAQAAITLSSGTTMPDNADAITLTVTNVPSLQPTPSGTPGTPGATLTSPTVSPVTPEPTNGLGGS